MRIIITGLNNPITDTNTYTNTNRQQHEYLHNKHTNKVSEAQIYMVKDITRTEHFDMV